MIDAWRHRAETHVSSSRLIETEERSFFLALPPEHDALFTPTNGVKRNTSKCWNMGTALPGGHGERGFMDCFFWCAQTGGPDDDGDQEDEEDPAVSLPDYLFGRRLGTGRQGEVRHAIQRSDGESVAVKCVKRNRHSVQEEESTLEEAAVLSKMSHQSIVRLLEFESLPHYHFLVLELLDGGDILEAVAGLASYTEHDARQIAIAVLKALRHAHEQGRCVHRDLRPGHLLLARGCTATARHGLGGRVKIAGWGRSKRLPHSGILLGEHISGNRAFAAPEIILEESYGTPADMYSFGAILYTLLGGMPPRAVTLATAARPKAPDTSGPAWGPVSSEAKALVGALMTPEGPDARMSAAKALGHEWIMAGEDALRVRSLDAVLKGARVLSWRGAMEDGRRNAGYARSSIHRTVSLF